MRKKLIVFIAACIMLCGCDNNEDKNTDNGKIMDAFAQISGETQLAAYPVSINGTQIKESPQKVVCLSESLYEIINELGYGDRVIGISTYFSEKNKSLKDVGKPANPDIDTIISMSPDVVFTSTAIANKDIVTLSDSGVDTVFIPSPRSAEEFERIYSAVGMVFDGMFDGEAKGAETFREIGSLLSSSDNKNCGSFIYITEGFSAAGKDTFENSILSSFGTSLTDKSGIVGYCSDTEKLSAISPDYVFLNNIYSLDELSKNEFFGQLDAVKENRVILIDNSYFEHPSREIIKLIKTINEQIS